MLFEDHAARVARYAARRIDPDDVQDVVSEVFLIAWRRLEDVPEDALPWLFATARHVIANRHRAGRRRAALNDKLAHPGPATQESPAPDGVDGRLVAAIARLPRLEREAFMLVAWDGLDPQRAARAARCSTATFRVRLHRARRRLRREVDPPRPFVAVHEITNSMEETP